MEFKLTIRLGNDAMQTGDQIADALRRVGELLRDFSPDTFHGKPHRVLDANGNTVGTWEIK